MTVVLALLLSNCCILSTFDVTFPHTVDAPWRVRLLAISIFSAFKGTLSVPKTATLIFQSSDDQRGFSS